MTAKARIERLKLRALVVVVEDAGIARVQVAVGLLLVVVVKKVVEKVVERMRLSQVIGNAQVVG